MNILLVEDDFELGNGIRIALVDQGFIVLWVRCLVDAQREMAASFSDLVLLDLGLPDGDGLALLKAIRREKQNRPVLILTARDALADRLSGLDSGADDYLVKPFALAELVSRIRAIARRSFGLTGDTIELRGLNLTESTMRVTVNGLEVNLSRSEFLILTILLKRSDRVVTRRFLEDNAILGGLNNESNVLDVHISNIRKKIGDGYLRTVRGVGYVIDREPPASKVAEL